MIGRALAVDAIVLLDNKIALIRRKNPPFEGYYALPGGFVERGETVEQALIREVKEETGLDIRIVKLAGAYSDTDRDPRGHVISLCYLAEASGTIAPDSDAGDVELFDVSQLPELAFDHEQMVNDAMEDINGLLS
ncbi:MAG: NUDIX hydrolase [Methanocellales archaeon]|nr:NUDIX hydrolase [Methanocellales archaeon]